MSEQLKFKISSALKDIIGRDLITDDFIAVFELVKNSYDAHATRVDITFENIESGNGRIIIKDNGKGMNYDDLINKWLFVAYSAKKEGTEDDNFDYRDSIYTNRPFAGAKGIGRFSCDRLGKQLYLETTKKESNPKTEVLITDWEQFEGDIKDEFVDINVRHETKKSSDSMMSHGTVLIIDDLRSFWDRNKYLRLKDSLAKLINPNSGKEEHQFKVFLHVKEELNLDNDFEDERKKVNGEIKNFIFETLGLKTTKISAKLSEDGDSFITEIKDGGTLIYRIKESNDLDLSDINITLYYLNQSAKLTFARRMGLSSRAYGHVFLYKNGFRIFPFGEPYEDPMKVDVRKSRKRNSRLGNGEIMGQIEIFGINEDLKETSSRGNGLIQNEKYSILVTFFYKVLERLERYVIDVQKWGLSIEENLQNEDQENIRAEITNLILELTQSQGIIDLEYGDNFLDFIKSAQSESVTTILQNLKQIAQGNNDDTLLEEVNKAEQRLTELKQANLDAEKERKVIQKELHETESQNLFLRSVKSQDLDEMVSFMHSVGISADIINNYINGLYKSVKKGRQISMESLEIKLREMSLENRKIMAISRFSTKANFKLYAEEVTKDLVEFVHEYCVNILKPLRQEKINIISERKNDESFNCSFKPIEITIIIDNLVSNSIRAKAERFWVNYEINDDVLKISFEDDGIGLKPEAIINIFDFGYTTTSGSGLGLYHVRNIIDKTEYMFINVVPKKKKGATFELLITKKYEKSN